MSVLKFCNSKIFNFELLEKLSDNQKMVCIKTLKAVEGNKILRDKVNKEKFELLKTFFFREKNLRDSWVIKSQIGKPGKDGTGYIVYHKDDPYKKEFIMKEFKSKKSFDKVRTEVKFQTLASIYDISPKIYEYGRKPNPYIIMDKMNGGTIIDVIKSQNGTISLKQQKELINIYEILDIIGINHNDSNLRNIMVNNDKIYIIDYGLSKFLKKDQTNFKTLNLSLITMCGYQSCLKSCPTLFLKYLEKGIHKEYWIRKNEIKI